MKHRHGKGCGCCAACAMKPLKRESVEALRDVLEAAGMDGRPEYTGLIRRGTTLEPTKKGFRFRLQLAQRLREPAMVSVGGF